MEKGSLKVFELDPRSLSRDFYDRSFEIVLLSSKLWFKKFITLVVTAIGPSQFRGNKCRRKDMDVVWNDAESADSRSFALPT